MRIVERIPAHYEAQEVEFGKSYKWCPEQVVVECGECKKRITLYRSKLLSSVVTCGCGARSTANVREELIAEQLAEDERLHPWRYWHTSKDTGLPF